MRSARTVRQTSAESWAVRLPAADALAGPPGIPPGHRLQTPQCMVRTPSRWTSRTIFRSRRSPGSSIAAIGTPFRVGSSGTRPAPRYSRRFRRQRHVFHARLGRRAPSRAGAADRRRRARTGQPRLGPLSRRPAIARGIPQRRQAQQGAAGGYRRHRGDRLSRADFFGRGREPLGARDTGEEGFRYSSSVYPIAHDLYGVPEAPRRPFCPLPGFIEIPLTTVRLFGRNFPTAGGGYFRPAALCASPAPRCAGPATSCAHRASSTCTPGRSTRTSRARFRRRFGPGCAIMSISAAPKTGCAGFCETFAGPEWIASFLTGRARNHH